MFGTQIGQAVGVLAGEVVGSTDIGLPLGPAGKAALLPLNIEALRQGPGRARRTRCGSTWPCARPPTSGSSRTCRGCARTCSARSRATRAGIKVDTAKLEEAVGQLDPHEPGAAAGGAPAGHVPAGGHPGAEGRPGPSGDGARAGRGLGGRGGRTRPPSRGCRPRTRCARRCAAAGPTGGPAEQTFATLIGLELRPRRLRDAARACGPSLDRRARRGRPRRRCGRTRTCCRRPTDLDDPDGFVHREQLDFSELDKMLGEAASGRRAADLRRRTDGTE